MAPKEARRCARRGAPLPLEEYAMRAALWDRTSEGSMRGGSRSGGDGTAAAAAEVEKRRASMDSAAATAGGGERRRIIGESLLVRTIGSGDELGEDGR